MAALNGRRIFLFMLLRRKRYNKYKKRFWIRPLLQRRKEQEEYSNLAKEMQLGDYESFFMYFRVTLNLFWELLSLVAQLILKSDSKREPIRPAERLAVALRCLSNGDSHQTIAYSYGLGNSIVTLSLIYFDISTHADSWAFLFRYNVSPLFHTSYLFCTASISASTNSLFQSIFAREFICSAIFLSDWA